MSLLRKLLSVKPVRAQLEFGINENVRLVNIDNEVRKYEGDVIEKNTFLTFAKFNDNNEKIAATEFSYFNLDHTSDFVFDNLINQIGHLNKICSLLGAENGVDPTGDYEDLDELKDALRTKKGCEKFMSDMWEQFSENVGDLVGIDSPLLRIKVINDTKSGKYLTLPKDDHFLELAEKSCTLQVTPFEMKIHAKGQAPQQEAPDDKGEGPDEKPKKKSTIKNL